MSHKRVIIKLKLYFSKRNIFLNNISRGLDNAGKTTILKRFNGEEIDTISPTLGFNIKTLEHRGLVYFNLLTVIKEKNRELTTEHIGSY